MDASASPAATATAPGTRAGTRGAAIRLAGLVIEGGGVILSGLSLGYIITDVNGNGTNYVSLETNFFSTLEAGIVVCGVGIVILAVGIFLQSRGY